MDQVYQSLRQLVDSTLGPGDKLPAMRTVAQEHGVNVHAVYSAVRRLEHEGRIVSERGRGVFVSKDRVSTQNVLLLNRSEGHMWADITQRFIERFSREPLYRLMVDMVPSQDSGMLPMFRQKLQSLPDNGIHTVIFNGIAENNMELVIDAIPQQVRKMCIFNRVSIPNSTIGGVSSNWYHGGYIAARHLIDVGCRHIVNIGPVSYNHEIGNAHGAVAAVDEGATDARIDSYFCRGFVNDVEHHLNELLLLYPKVDGIITHGDFVAAPLIKSLQARGMRVPHDVAVVGYYNTPWVDLCDPTLSSVDPCCTQISDMAIDMALAGDFVTQTIVHPKLVIRNSTKR